MKPLYNELCENTGISKWNWEQCEEISREAKDITREKVKSFLIEAQLLCELGWGKENFDFNEWSFESMIEIFQLKKYSHVSWSTMNLVKISVKYNLLRHRDFITFLNTLRSNFPNIIQEDNNLHSIFTFFFDEVDVYNYNQNKESIKRNQYFWIRNKKDLFNDFLKTYFEIYRSEYNTTIVSMGVIHSFSPKKYFLPC